VICQLWRAIAGKKIGVITSIGLGTFVDPRKEGAKITSITTEDLVKLIEIEGQELLLYKPFPINVAIIRGTYADENGNLTMDNESVIMEALPLAMAVKNSGGIVIAQAHYLAARGSLPPKNVKVPGTLVDYVVIAKPENHHQTQQSYFNPALAGQIKVPLTGIAPLELDARKIIGRRAAVELAVGNVINLGVGIPAVIPSVIAEEGVTGAVTTTTELGVFGGVPAIGLDFGGAFNAEAMIEHASMFDYYDGGGLDVTFVGLAQADENGNVNVSRFGKRVAGPGGFINITQNTKKVVFCGMFTIGSEEVVENGKLRITKEGNAKKFIKAVEQITFSGEYAKQRKSPVMFITERGVLSLENGELILKEIAPGVDLDRDILGMMYFKPRIANDLKTMDETMFLPTWGRLKKIISKEAGDQNKELDELAAALYSLQ
jgi:propionate CoA-transferase